MMLKIKYSYQSSQVLLSQNPIRYEAEIRQAHLIGERYGQQVFCRLNHFHKHNILNSGMIGQIYRHLESYDLDEAVRIIWLDCQSKGTDLKYLLHISPEERINYLRQIQNLAVYFGQYNKQLLPIIEGEMSGSAASLACTTPFQLFAAKGGIRFNDVNKGFVPHAGTTYHLSRLPDELGMYFALTGRWITKDEAIESGLVYGRLNDRDSAINLIHQNIQQYHYPTTWEMYPSEINKQIQQYTEGYDRFLQELSEEMINRMKREDPKLVATELIYKLKRFEEENVIKAKQNQVQQRIANPYLRFKELIIDDFEELNIISRLTKVTLDKPLIARCFSGKSVAEIMERLRSEESDFAKKILEELQAQPQLSLELTYKMIRQAEKQQWRDCLVTEHNVASNFANSGEMQKQSKIQNIDSFFDSVKPEIDYLPNALEPVKDFYKEFPDNVRYFLNEQNLRKGLRERTNQEIDVGSFMLNNEHPIDGTIQVSELRRMRMEIADLKRDLHLNMQKLQSLIGYEENLTKYCQERQQYLDNLKDIDEVFQLALTNYFDHANQARLNSYNEVAKVAVTKQKRKLFSLVRNALLNQRLTNDPDDPTQFEKYQAWLRSMNRLLIFPKDDSLSFFDGDLPDYDKIVDKECDEQQVRSREFRGKLFETRYGDPYQDHQKSLNKFYGGMVRTVVESKRFPNITQYLKGREANEIIQELKQNHEEIKIELKKVEKSQKTLNVEQIKKELSEILKPESLDQNLSTMINSDPYLSQGFLKLFAAPKVGIPLIRKFIQMLKAAYNARIKKIEKLQGIPVIDDEINNALILQSFASIEDNLFFSYSYALLIELEEIFNIFKSSGDREVQIAKLEEIYGIKELKPNQEMQLLKYLDRCLKFATDLYNTYREKALKSEEKVLDYFATLSQSKFVNTAIYRNRLLHKTKQSYQRELQTLSGNPEYKYSMDEFYPNLEKDQTQKSLKQQLMRHLNKKDWEYCKTPIFDGEVREDVFMPNSNEIELFAKAISMKTKKCKELIVGLHYQLKSLDLIAEKQVVITPTHIQEQKAQLEDLLNRKWFSHKNLDEWFQEMAEETVANLYHPEMLLSMEEFRRALQIHWDSEKKLLEGLRAELILGIQNEKDTEIQKQKFQQEIPEIQNLARQLTVSESFAQQGLMDEPEEMEALFIGHFGSTLKETGFLPPKINEAGYRELRSKMIQRVEHLVTEWSKEPKLIEQDEIDSLYEKIQQLQNRDK